MFLPRALRKSKPQEANPHNHRLGIRTSRRSTISCTRFMILAFVASEPPSPFDGFANSMGVPLRRSPRDNNKLLMYVEAVYKFWESIVVMSALSTDLAELRRMHEALKVCKQQLRNQLHEFGRACSPTRDRDFV